MFNQQVNLGRRPTPARPDIAILKDGYFFFKNPSKNGSEKNNDIVEGIVLGLLRNNYTYRDIKKR